MPYARVSVGLIALCIACTDQTSEPAAPTDTTGTARSTASWVVHTTADCSGPGIDTVTVDTAASCNVTGDGSASNVACYADRLTYTNHPNNGDCSSNGVANTLSVGVCQEFPGPLRTWKYIDPATYDCAGK